MCQKVNSTLKSIINTVWVEAYGGVGVHDIISLQNRVRKLAEDRQCWIANAKTNQKEYLRLQLLLNPKMHGDFYEESK